MQNERHFSTLTNIQDLIILNEAMILSLVCERMIKRSCNTDACTYCNSIHFCSNGFFTKSMHL